VTVVRIPKPTARLKTGYKAMEDVFNVAYGWLRDNGYLAGYHDVAWVIVGYRKLAVIGFRPGGGRRIADVFIGRKYLHIMPLISPKR